MPLEALVERPEDAAAKVSSAGTLVEDKLANEDEQGALDVRRMLDEVIRDRRQPFPSPALPPLVP
jgi:hypothetical protein